MEGIWNAAFVGVSMLCTSAYVLHYVCWLPIGYGRLRASLPVFLFYLCLPPIAADPRQNAVGSIILSTFLSWWANFKLLALCWGTGPLTTHAVFTKPPKEQTEGSDDYLAMAEQDRGPKGFWQRGGKAKANSTAVKTGPAGTVPKTPGLLHFTAILVLPMAFEAGVEDKDEATAFRSLLEALGCLAVFISCIYVFDFRHLFSPLAFDLMVVPILYSFLLFMFCLTASFAKGLLRIRLASHFHNPFLSSSLTDFWGRRWNRVAQHLLRDSTYRPIKNFLATQTTVGRTTAHAVAVVCTFVVSGVMHELIIYYAIGHLNGLTLEWTAFFMLHALGVTVEGLLWNFAKHRRIPPLPYPLCWLWVATFFVVTVRGLFLPPVKRNGLDVAAISNFRKILPGPSLANFRV